MSGPIYHGGRLDLAMVDFGGTRDDWLDLSTGINPHAYGIGEVSDDVWRRLPGDQAEQDLLYAARTYYRVSDASGIVAANGTQALIEMLPKALALSKIAIVAPTYGEHKHSWEKAGVGVVEISREDAIPDDCDGLLIVNPNNPDGHVFGKVQLTDFAARMAKRNGYLIVDEAFCDVLPEASFVDLLTKNVLIYRSFGKFFGLAGLRLGFLIGPASLTAKVKDLIGPWSVSGPALEIGKRAFEDVEWSNTMRNTLAKLAADQAALLQECGLHVAGVNPLFIYTAHEHSANIFQELAKQHILVRPFPAMNNRLRFGICANPAELNRLETALRHCFGQR